MINNWSACKNILVIRPDNMGDLLMTTPAIRALKETFDAKITVLTSAMAAGIARQIPEIDDVITFDVPWIKTTQVNGEAAVLDVVAQLKEKAFDAAVIFTVYSQNPMPTVMLAYLAGIPLRLAYCRENPYQLLTNWVPDKEPYDLIRHQVRRDLDLVTAVGAVTNSERLSLDVPGVWPQVAQKLQALEVDTHKPWLLMHPGVSEPKREYPADKWAKAARQVVDELGYQVLLTGAASEQALAQNIQHMAGQGVYSVAGQFKLDEFAALIKQAPMLVSVNTGTIHIAAATGTPTVVLYALTNPQHTPWRVACKVLPFSIPAEAQSKNEVIVHVNKLFNQQSTAMPSANDIVAAIRNLLNNPMELNEELVGL
ncbi:glycosyltransferase family 9 protein [Mucilaginibacter sp. Bleaf8]|uniref:glycosyltransferase family 9 protein n=1 Tax=Mucilaginibacter sp. Bleaf8 TaxID=2834430 RepID=UPI001BCF048C|nr:glycosyltransferase family 9 protein [Mucilaginibacter sp. Bleaf8]MBS7565004.1 glycosyltransferase family 9 protein [Mucilaginibacter sp. Bleaf8]